MSTGWGDGTNGHGGNTIMNEVPESLIDTVAEAISGAVERGDNLDHVAVLAIRAAAPGIEAASLRSLADAWEPGWLAIGLEGQARGVALGALKSMRNAADQIEGKS